MTSTRAGRYLEQPGGYRAFVPVPLPPDPPIRYDADLMGFLSKADRALGRLDGATAMLPNPDLFVFMYVRKEAVLSSQIEGTQASLIDVLEFQSGQAGRADPVQISEVVNYVDAMNYGLARLRSLPVSLRLLREIHERLMVGVRGGERDPGEFRRVQNWIGADGAPIQAATFVPPPPAQIVPALGELERFLNEPQAMPALVKVGLAHAQFETIHPFLDGNGRAGRLLITFLLCEQDILRQPLLYLSHYFKRHRAEYYDRLQAIREEGDWERWLTFFLRGVFEVAQEATQTAHRIQSLREHDREQITTRLPHRSGSALRLLEGLYFQPVVSVHDAARITDLAYANANELVGQLQSIGILTESTGHRRNRRFRYERYLDLFTDPDTEAPRLARS